MPERQKKLIFRCVYCAKDTTIVVTIQGQLATQPGKIAVVRSCEHCHRANKLEVPDNIDVHPLILERDQRFLGYHGTTPIIQGEEDR